MQVVNVRPRQIASPDAVHRRAVAGPPGHGKLGPVHVRDALGRGEPCPFVDDGAAPVHDGTEDIEREGVDRDPIH